MNDEGLNDPVAVDAEVENLDREPESEAVASMVGHHCGPDKVGSAVSLPVWKSDESEVVRNRLTLIRRIVEKYLAKVTCGEKH